MENVSLFLNHTKYIFQDDTEHVLDWMADMVQNPTVPVLTHVLHANVRQRTGRGWVASLVDKVVSDHKVFKAVHEFVPTSEAMSMLDMMSQLVTTTRVFLMTTHDTAALYYGYPHVGVTITDSVPRSREYYSTLYEHLADEEFVNSVRAYLMNRDVQNWLTADS